MRSILAYVSTATLAFAIAGCGGGGGSTDNAAPATPAVTPPATATAPVVPAPVVPAPVVPAPVVPAPVVPAPVVPSPVAPPTAPAPVAPAPVIPTASSNGTTIVAPATNAIIDNGGNSWSLVNGKVYENGSPYGVSSNVIMLLWYNGLIFQQNSACGIWSASNGTWKQTTFPVGFTLPPTVGNTCSTTIAGLWIEGGGAYPYALPSGGYSVFVAPTGDFYFTGSGDAHECGGTISVSNGVVSGTCVGASVFFKPSVSGCAVSLPPASCFVSEEVSGYFDGQTLTLAFTDYTPPGSFTRDSGSAVGSSFAAVTGNWSAYDPSEPPLSISSTGAMYWPSKYGCDSSGQISVTDPAVNVYSIVRWTSIGSNCGSGLGVTYTGMATLTSYLGQPTLEIALIIPGEGDEVIALIPYGSGP
jgi:hypothetical protein